MNGSGPWYSSNPSSYSGDGGFGGDFGGGNYGYGSYANGFGDSWDGGKAMKGDTGKGGGKTATLCKFFLQGNCTRGTSCTFSHGDGGAGSKDWGCNPAQKPVCKFFLQGTCTRGSTCIYSHSTDNVVDNIQGDVDDPDLLEIQDAIAKKQLEQKGGDDVEEMMAAEMAEMERIDEAQRDMDNESEGSDALPPPATEGEIAEAREIFKKAQDDLKERNRMKELVKDANQSDLQALINARLAKK